MNRKSYRIADRGIFFYDADRFRALELDPGEIGRVIGQDLLEVGDLLVCVAPGIVARFPAPTQPGLVLTSDPGGPFGIKWEALEFVGSTDLDYYFLHQGFMSEDDVTTTSFPLYQGFWIEESGGVGPVNLEHYFLTPFLIHEV